MAGKTPIRVLIIEDSEFDARILLGNLKQGGYDPVSRRVDTAPAMQEALATERWDVVLSDYNLPEFSAPAALELLQQSGLDIPFIIISGGIGEDVAVGAMKLGAHDYLMKGNLARLAPAVERELREADIRRARRQAEEALRESEQRYRLLWENSADAVIVMNADSTVRFVNPAVDDLFGYRPEELVGVDFTQLLAERVHAEYRDWAAAYLTSDTLRSRSPFAETIGRRKDGTEIFLDAGFTHIHLHGAPCLVAFIRDITERKRAEEELRENEEQFRVAREIQQRLFPKHPPTLPGYDIAGLSLSAEATGGDYFDYPLMINDRLGIAVGDVTGHGIGPALLMAETRAYLRIVARNRENLGEILTRVNRVLAEDVGFERFVTILLVGLDPTHRTLTYANAGHPAGYVLDASGAIRMKLKRTGLPLGIKPDTLYQPGESLQLEHGDVVFLFTDGIEEAMSPDDELFGVERALDVVKANRGRSAQEMLDALFAAVREFTRDTLQLDDSTVVILKVL